MSVNPGPSRDDMTGDSDAPHDGTNAGRGDGRTPGSNVRPGYMGPQDMRGQ